MADSDAHLPDAGQVRERSDGPADDEIRGRRHQQHERTLWVPSRRVDAGRDRGRRQY